MTLPGEDEDEDRRARAELRRYKGYAGGLLLAAGGGFIAANLVPAPNLWVQLARTTCEAGLIGGLADWFAVTALFRHPLGIPIPHTAIIPAQKDRIGAGLGRFVARNFLAPDPILAKLRSSQLGLRFAQWLSQPANADKVAERITAGLPRMINAFSDKDIRRFLRQSIGARLKTLDLGPAAARMIESFAADGHHLRLLDDMLGTIDSWLEEHRDLILQQVADNTAWYVPRMVDRAIAGRLVAGLRRYLAEIRDPGHETRVKLDAAARDYLERLKSDPAFLAQIATVRDRLLTQPDTQRWLEAAWDHVRSSLLADLERPQSRLRSGLTDALVALGKGLQTDEAVRTSLDQSIEAFVLSVIVPARDEIGGFIADVVKGWEADQMAERAELAVGRDLQYIRMNGTLVGALIGAILFLIERFALAG